MMITVAIGNTVLAGGKMRMVGIMDTAVMDMAVMAVMDTLDMRDMQDMDTAAIKMAVMDTVVVDMVVMDAVVMDTAVTAAMADTVVTIVKL